MKIHHATIAKAKKFQIALVIESNEIVATDRKGVRLASGMQGNKVLEDAITKMTGKAAKGIKPTAEKPARKPRAKKVVEQDEEETGDESEAIAGEADTEEESQSKSIVKAKYRALYKPHKDRSGDTLSHDVNKHVSRESDDGDMKVDLSALRRFAKANGTWVESYSSLKSRTGTWNSGQAVMNTNNRLRAKIRQAKKAGEELEIKWV